MTTLQRASMLVAVVFASIAATGCDIRFERVVHEARERQHLAGDAGLGEDAGEDAQEDSDDGDDLDIDVDVPEPDFPGQ